MSKFILRIYLKIQKLKFPIHKFITYLILRINEVEFKDFNTKGIPYIRKVSGKFVIGYNFRMVNSEKYNTIGRQDKCKFVVKGILKIGNNVGISSTTIICHKQITIGNNVIIGGNTVIYDTDFHSINPQKRLDKKADQEDTKKREVIIEDNVFIGAHSTILKGTHIGKNSVIGACSVVCGYIPENEIWGGNPAKFIKKTF